MIPFFVQFFMISKIDIIKMVQKQHRYQFCTFFTLPPILYKRYNVLDTILGCSKTIWSGNRNQLTSNCEGLRHQTLHFNYWWWGQRSLGHIRACHRALASPKMVILLKNTRKNDPVFGTQNTMLWSDAPGDPNTF